ncbi:MAG: hypothetical protein N2512_06850 [Armatimonadetes bacterium]|nr:hypothetical protein [Armatimonadota bacterium]
MVIPALLWALAGAILEPAAPENRTILVDDQGAVWLVIEHPLAPSPGPVAVVWPMAEPGIDLASACVLGCTPEGAVTVLGRRETADAVEWKLSVGGTGEDTSVRLAARLPELRVEWRHLVAVDADGAEWVLAAAVSGWKSAPADNVVLRTPFGTCEGISLQPEVMQTLVIWSSRGVDAQEVLRWDSRDGRETASRVLVFQRDLASEFGGRPLPPGKVTVNTPTRRLVQDFPGASPGSRIELQAGDAPAILVKRIKAASTQVDVRTDANRRLAAFTERLEYEYVVSNSLPEPVELELVEHPARGWEVIQASAPWEKRDADTLVFTVALQARGQAKVTATLVRRNQTPA